MPIYKEALTYIFVLFSENYFDSLFAAIGKEDWAEKIENYLTQNDWEWVDYSNIIATIIGTCFAGIWFYHFYQWRKVRRKVRESDNKD